MNLKGTIQSDPEQSGMYVIQDDSLLTSWSGILLDPGSVQRLDLKRGDEVTIQRGRIAEIDGSTVVQALRAVRTNAVPVLYPRVVATTEELRQPDIAESLEGMLVRVENASVLDQADETTWEIWNGSVLDAIDLSTESPSVSSTGLEIWQTRPFIDGVWIQRGESWVLIPESESYLGEVINVVVDDEYPVRPGLLSIEGTYPNPFTDRASIEYLVDRAEHTKVEVFDVTGRLVRVLVDGPMPAGRNVAVFDAGGLAPGPYVVRLSSASDSDADVVLRIE
jgi:hypothetical protein